MRLLMLNRIMRCYTALRSDSMRPGTASLIVLLLLGLILPTTIFTAYLHMSTMQSVRPSSDALASSNQASVVKKSISSKPLNPWQRHIKGQCQKFSYLTNAENDVIKPKLFKHFLVDDKYKVIYCQIPKVATTTWRRIFIIMTGKSGTNDMMALKPDDVHHKHDELLTYLSDLSADQIRYRLDNYLKFVFVREPFERVLSAYRNKFNTKYQPMSMFHTLYSRRIIKRYRPQWKQTPEDLQTGKITFQEFVDYLIDPNPPLQSNEHWEEYHKLCHPCLVDYDFIGKLESVQEDSEYILRKSGIDKIIKFPDRRESNYKTKATNTLIKDFYSQISGNKLKELLKVYKEDFAIFNYTVPQDVQSLINSNP